MPFKPPFKNNFTTGDLIYGLSESRKCYFNASKYFKRARSSLIFPYIDSYIVTANELLKLESIKRGNPSSPLLNLPSNQREFIDTLLQHPKYKDASMIDVISVIKDGKVFSLDNPTAPRIKCKAGLYWATQKQNFQVHFILDGINFKEVVLKSNKRDTTFNDASDFIKYLNEGMEFNGNCLSGQIKNRSITGSELRWIYRNRSQKSVQKTIQFWYNYKACCAPWDPDFNKIYGSETAHLWESYVPKYYKSCQPLSRERGAVFNLATLFSCIGLRGYSEQNSQM